MKDAMKQKAAKQDTNSEIPQKLSVKERFEKRLSLVISYLEENLKDKGKAKILVLKETKQGKNKVGPGTVSAALKTVKAGSKALVETMNKQVELGSVCLNKKLNGRALERDFLTNEWPWPEHLPECLSLKALIAMADPTPPGEIDWSNEEASSWPSGAAPKKVAEWAQKKLDSLKKGLGNSFLEAIENQRLPKVINHEKLEVSLPTSGLALLYLAQEEIENGLRRPAIYIDAGLTNHDMTLGWLETMPKPYEEVIPRVFSNRIELLNLHDKTFRAQLRLPYEEWPLHDSLLRALGKLVRPFGLRNWWALLRLLSVEGGRRGWVRWTMKDHLDALGLSQRKREDTETLKDIAKNIELFTKLVLVGYDKTGEESVEAPLLIAIEKNRKLLDSRWRLDGVTLQINPLLYEGVRNMSTGQLGNKFFPAPIDLARIDHRNERYALALGGILPIRWQWNIFGKQSPIDHLALSGKNLLDLAQIVSRERHEKEAWKKLDRALKRLEKIEMLGRYEWDKEPHTMNGIIRLYPHDIWLDRTLGGLKPIELPPMKIPRSGSELKEWRKEEGLNQREAAEKLKVTRRTFQRAEAEENKSLGKSILRGFEKLGDEKDDKKKGKKDKNRPPK